MSTSTETRTFGNGDLAKGLSQLRKVMEDTPAAAEQAAVMALNQRWRKLYLRTIAAVVLVLLIFVGAGWYTFNRLGLLSGQVSGQDAAIQRSEQTIAAFEGQLATANDKLRALGLPTVAGPVSPAPGSPQQAELINAASVASTLAAIGGDASPIGVSGDQVAKAVAGQLALYMQDNPVAVPTDAVIAAVADYIAANQEILRGPKGLTGDQGPQGDQGPPGATPTAEEIRAAFREEVAANPNLLCPVGGTYGARTLALADGGTTEQFGCFGNDTGPSGPGPDPGPDPGTGGNAGGDGAATPPPPTPGGTTAPETPQGTTAPTATTEPAPPPETTTQAPGTTTQAPPPGFLDLLTGNIGL